MDVIAIFSFNVPDLRNNETPVRIGEYSLKTHVRGLFARVETEFTLCNDNGRTFEGELEFPLPDDGVVCGYAIDIDGVMTPATVVEKEKARIAFEEEVKRGVDPGLVEQVRGNAYRTRIYPIFAHGMRRVRIEYVMPLTVDSNGTASIFLPMPSEKLAKRDVLIDVDVPNVQAPQIIGLGNHNFTQAETVWHVECHETDVKPDDHLRIVLPTPPSTVTNLENNDGDTYFAASVFAKPSDTHRDMPAKWRIFWDASGSRNAEDIKLARGIIEALPEKAEFELHVFSNKPEAVQTISARDVLLETLDAIHYDGGTDYASIKDEAAKSFDGMTLFFSDGIDTVTCEVPEIGENALALASGSTRDIAVLRRICGGHVLDLKLNSPQNVLDYILNPPAVVSGVQGAGIANVQGIGAPATGCVTVLGRLKTAESHAEIVLSDGQRFPIVLEKSKARNGNTIAAAWASKRINELSPNAEANREELLAVGKHFSIVSPVSSLIVFETLDQWIKYDIEPPASLESLHESWIKNRLSAENRRASDTQNWISQLNGLWDARIRWWESPIPKINKPRSGIFDDNAQPNMRRATGGAPVRELRPRLRESAPAAMMGMAAPMANMSAPAPRPVQAMQSMSGPTAGAPAPMPARAEARFDWNALEEQEAPQSAAVRDESPRESFSWDDDEGGEVTRECRCEVDECCEAPCEECNDERPNSASTNRPSSGSITIQAWDPKTPYLEKLKNARKVFGDNDEMYAEYLKIRSQYKTCPAFYLDCAGLFFKENMKEIAIRILSNLSELKIDDVALLRVYAWRLREAGELDTAVVILRKVAKLRADEAVSARDLALTLTLRAKQTHSKQDAEEALELFKLAAFTHRIRRDAIYTAIVALEEFNELAHWCSRQTWPDGSPTIPEIDEKYRKLMDLDLRIVLMWDADETDIDLHVLEPSGEEVYYSNNRSASGAMLSNDVTTGYGPEEYLHLKAIPGTYQIMSNYFASHQQKLTGNVTVTATVFTDWGRDNEKSQTMSLRLEKAKEHVKIGEIKVG